MWGSFPSRLALVTILATCACICRNDRVLSAAPSATQPATTQQQPAWNDLLTRLGSNDYKVRAAAQRELAGIPPEHRDTLQRLAEQASDPEVSASLKAQVVKFDEWLALSPPPVSVQLDKATIAEAFAQLSKQIGMPITAWPKGNTGQITLQMEKQPFWNVIAEINKQSPITFQGMPGQVNFVVGAPQNRALTSVGQTGAFSVSLASLLSQVTWDAKPLAEMAPTREFSAHFLMQVDPRIRVAMNGTTFRLLELQDDSGKSLLPRDFPDTVFPAAINPWLLTHVVKLPFPQRPSERIKLLKGEVTWLAEVGATRVDFKARDPEGTQAHADGMAVSLQKVTVTGRRVDVAISVKRDAMTEEQWKERILHVKGVMKDFPMQIELRDEEGNSEVLLGGGKYMEDSVDLKYTTFDSKLPLGPSSMDALRIRFSLTSKTSEVKVPFEFRDLPMP